MLNKEDLEFLQTLSIELKRQDNAATAAPIFLVQDEKRIWGNFNGEGVGLVWVEKEDTDNYFYQRSDLFDYLKTIDGFNFNDTEEVDEYIEEHFDEYEYITEYQYKVSHLTRKAAEQYIKANRHNLYNPRIYVKSQYRCHEFNQLIEIIRKF